MESFRGGRRLGTGASGLGRLMTERLLARGDRVVATVRHEVLPSRGWFISSIRGNQAVEIISTAAHPR